MIFYRISKLILPAFIQRYDKKSFHFLSSSKNERLSDAAFYGRINTIYQFIKPFLDKKKLFLRNMELLMSRMICEKGHMFLFPHRSYLCIFFKTASLRRFLQISKTYWVFFVCVFLLLFFFFCFFFFFFVVLYTAFLHNF